MIATNFEDRITDQATRKMIGEQISAIAIPPDAIAQPPEIGVSSIVIRPTTQG